MLVKYTVKRKGWKTQHSFPTLEEAIESAENDTYFFNRSTGKAHNDVFIVKETHEKVWAGSSEELFRPLKGIGA